MNEINEPAKPDCDTIRSITAQLLSRHADLIWVDEDRRREAIANAIETAVMIYEMTEDVEE